MNSFDVPRYPHVAGLWKKALAALIDLVLVLGAFYYAATHWGQDLPDGGKGWSGLDAIPPILLIEAYWTLPEWIWGTSLGKWIFGLRLISMDGKDCSFVQSVKRNVLRVVDAFMFYLVGFLVAKFTPNRQRLGDLWAGTIVVEARRISERVSPSN